MKVVHRDQLKLYTFQAPIWRLRHVNRFPAEVESDTDCMEVVCVPPPPCVSNPNADIAPGVDDVGDCVSQGLEPDLAGEAQATVTPSEQEESDGASVTSDEMQEERGEVLQSERPLRRTRGVPPARYRDYVMR